eukprot:4179881-Pyramimonas_sp.AAC.1
MAASGTQATALLRRRSALGPYGSAGVLQLRGAVPAAACVPRAERERNEYGGGASCSVVCSVIRHAAPPRRQVKQNRCTVSTLPLAANITAVNGT